MKTHHILLALLVAFVWGLNFLAVNWAVKDFPPMMANMLRFTVVLFLLFPFLRVVQHRMRPLILVAVVLGIVHFGLIFLGMAMSEGVGAVAIAAQLNVPFATLLAILMLGETVGWKRTFGIALSFVGVLVIGFDPIVFLHWPGLLAVIASAFFYALAAVMMRQLKDVRAATVQAWVALAGVVGSLVVSSLFETGQGGALKEASSLAWAAVLYSGIGSSIIGHGGANYLLRHYPVSVVSPYFLSVPVFAVMGAVVILGETISAKLFVGGILTVVGILIVTLRNNSRAAEKSQN